MASPTYVSAGARTDNSSTTSAAPGLPAGSGNFVLGLVHVRTGATVSTATSGWTPIDQDDDQALFWSPNSGIVAPTFTWTGNSNACSILWLFDGADTSGPLGTIGAPDIAATNPHTSTGFNTTRDDSLVVYIDSQGGTALMPQPSGWTEFYDLANGVGTNRMTIGGKAIASSGSASGNISETSGTSAWVQRQIEILSPVAGGTITRSYAFMVGF